jgi:hypothetical protein
MDVFVEGIGLRGPGLSGWLASSRSLAGTAPYESSPIVLSSSLLLPPAERRRAIISVKLALAVGEEAISQAQLDASKTATVFTSSGGDGEIIGQILETLATPAREVSPTRFHNCVHNAPAGYWGSASRSRERSTNVACFDASFAAGLLEAAVEATVDGCPILLIAYDSPHTPPVHATRPICAVFGVGLVLRPSAGACSLARLNIEIRRDADEPARMEQEALETLRKGNPAARSLPLLAALARRAEERIVLEYVGDNRLVVTAAPC